MVAVVLLACSADDDTPASLPTTTQVVHGDLDRTSLPPWRETVETTGVLPGVDVLVGIEQARHLEGSRRFQAATTFTSTEPITVRSIVLRSNLFEELPAEPKDSLLTPGRTVDLQFDLGPADCAVDDVTPTAAVVVELSIGDDTNEAVLLAMDAPTGFLLETHARDCQLADVGEAASITFGSFEPPTDTGVRTQIVLTRHGGTETVTATDFRGSVILHVDTAPDPSTLVLEPGVPGASSPVTIEVTRCDPHGLAGSQRTFVFAAFVAVGDRSPVYVEFRPPDDLEAALREAIRNCVASGRGR